ncbi:hypothetical protein SRABI27_03078 [Pedobacter sp. Bi27]|uniref:hypothetical protein n=1 Tax=unclassified Pedobacter TaxID=2628915 RepID=UPI001DBFE593|nr:MULTISPECIES: hypothetical protein [unclassified Pedobacter]CAH0140870.1 hypothetical protein SRABI36_00541 [Pedobacter sp. Bi36]CAH0196604.1 hypothetical protein SRABI126_01635 [Pedobacter sp. Bi126]CAH0255544.1 hypothetical protein SRABI27_03078 [Pedobacter sp. Bi27]
MKHLILLGTLCLAVFSAAAQSVEYKLIDFKKDTSQINTLKIKTGSRLGLKISNINKKLYTIDNIVTQTSYNETAPALFELFSKAKLPGASAESAGFTPDDFKLFTATQIADAKLPASVTKKLSNLNDLYFNTADTLIENENRLTEFGNTYKEVKNILRYQMILKDLQNDCDRPFTEIRSRVFEETKNAFTNSTMAPEDRLLLDAPDYVIIPGVLERYFDKIIETNVRIPYKELTIAFALSKRDQLGKNVTKANALIIELIGLIEKEKKVTDTAKVILKTLKDQRDDSKLSQLYKDNMENYNKTDIPKLNSDMEAFNATARFDVINDFKYFNEGNWTYIVDPQPIEDDLTVITVNIKAKEAVACSQLMRSYIYKVRPKGGLKIDFSTGLFINYGGNDFKDQTYRYDPIEGNTTQQKIVKNDSKNAIFPSVGALMHIYRRTASDVKLAGAFGLSTRDLERINYHAGASLIFGTSKRFILSAGATLTKATLITDKYQDGQVIDKAGAPEAIPTASFSRFGFFGAFTYNLSAK